MTPGRSTRIVFGMGLRAPSQTGTSTTETTPSNGARRIYSLTPFQLGDGSFNGYTNRSEVVYPSNVVAVVAGQSHTLFLKSDDSLWGMGNNTFGQLGDGFVDSATPNGTALPEKIFPSPQPVLTCAISSRTNLQISATTGFGGNLYLLGTTNIALQLNQWPAVRTNLITTRGTNNFSITLTNAVNFSSRQLYLLQ